MQQYSPGQRWISDSEAELGLGTLISTDGRILSIFYPASGETRQYSLRTAPLTRVRFVPGDEISHHEGWLLTVQQVVEESGLLTYQGLNSEGAQAQILESELSSFIRFRLASDRLLAGQVDPLPWFELRYRSLMHRSQQQQSELWGLAGARTQLLAHQLHIGKEVSDRIAPRVLLADEVGLGKTIEAGLIIHRQLLTGRASRILLIVPESLIHQWLVELLRRFNLHATIFDTERIAASDADNPFEDTQIALLSLDWISQDEQAQQHLLQANWDIMVVDEAHHLRWHPEQPSAAYTLIEKLASQIAGVLLLTATPEQLGHASHFARLRLLDPKRFHSLEQLEAETSNYQIIAEASNELIDKQQLSEKNQKVIQELLGDTAKEAIKLASTGDSTAAKLIIRSLLDRHGTGRILFRNTRTALDSFPERCLHSYPLDLPQQYSAQHEQLKAMLYPELLFQAEQLAEDKTHWWQFDPRVDWLLEQLKQLKREKVLLICANAYTALDLEEALRVRSGVAATTFHEGMSIIERDRAAAWFADEEYGAQILLCSEIGSEGRNFQFAHHLILFDLPLHPDLLEQRIGRLDRIGQQHSIKIHVPYFNNSAQQRLFDWYHQAHDAFLSTSPAGQALQEQYQEQLQEFLQQPLSKPEQWQQLINNAANTRAGLCREMQQGRDRLLEINSSGRENGEEYIANISSQDSSYDLPIYMEQLFEAFGIHSEDHSDNAFILRPSEKMLDASFPLGSDEAVTITYDRELALSREDMQFVTWEHPMVQGGMDLVLSSSMGNSCVALLNNKAIKPGTMLVEMLFVSETIAPKHLQLSKYLPTGVFRCLLDDKGNDLAAKVSFENLNAQLGSVPRASASKFARNQRELMQRMATQAEQKINSKHQKRTASARQAYSSTLEEEINRLRALQQVNPSIRDDEITTLEQQLAEGLRMLDKAAVRLEAVRLIVAG